MAAPGTARQENAEAGQSGVPAASGGGLALTEWDSVASPGPVRYTGHVNSFNPRTGMGAVTSTDSRLGANGEQGIWFFGKSTFLPRELGKAEGLPVEFEIFRNE